MIAILFFIIKVLVGLAIIKAIWHNKLALGIATVGVPVILFCVAFTAWAWWAAFQSFLHIFN